MNLVWCVLAAVFGAIIGSFLNVVIVRLPQKGASLAFPASYCPQCKRPLFWYENVPVFSYLLLRGRCRTCHCSISLRYLVVEVAMAVLAVLVLQRYGLSFESFYYCIFCALLLVIIFIDIQHQIIPDSISRPGILLGFAGAFFTQAVTWQESGLGILCGGGILYVLAFGYFVVTKREGMGGGDIKLLAMIGAFLGWQSLLYIVFASSLMGSMIGLVGMLAKKVGWLTKIPYGPFLALAALSYLFLQEQIYHVWRWYLSSAGL